MIQIFYVPTDENVVGSFGNIRRRDAAASSVLCSVLFFFTGKIHTFYVPDILLHGICHGSVNIGITP
jgi:hypothetical protein